VNHQILIVEDDPLLRRGMCALLRPHGHALVAAGTVAEARAHLAAGPPSHAIVDLNLPDGTGADVVREIRGRGLPARVMILTGSPDADLVAAARALGVDAVVAKPPDWNAVVRWAAGPADGGGGNGAPT